VLGEGAFGTVVKAQAVGIAGVNDISTVAIKMLKGEHSEIHTIAAYFRSVDLTTSSILYQFNSKTQCDPSVPFP